MSTKKVESVAHRLVPKHEVISEKEKEAVYAKYNIDFEHLPKIFAGDPALKGLSVKVKDVIKVTRPSRTAGEAIYYRGVVHE
ncbi:MAG: DNA-directed RNA polymerase subunit H [Candidatus Woesearchaeota archaeon]|nr:MAG: DNA-directed RNA polymerase subunit H [Candidatus Woesearchaeota archaeon]